MIGLTVNALATSTSNATHWPAANREMQSRLTNGIGQWEDVSQQPGRIDPILVCSCIPSQRPRCTLTTPNQSTRPTETPEMLLSRSWMKSQTRYVCGSTRMYGRAWHCAKRAQDPARIYVYNLGTVEGTEPDLAGRR